MPFFALLSFLTTEKLGQGDSAQTSSFSILILLQLNGLLFSFSNKKPISFSEVVIDGLWHKLVKKY